MLLIKNDKNTIQVFWIQAHTKVFRSYGGKYLKHILTYLFCIKYNEINMCHLDIHKNVIDKKWQKYYKYFVYKVIENFPILWGKIFKAYIMIFYIALIIIKLTYVIQIYKSMFPMKYGLNSINTS